MRKVIQMSQRQISGNGEEKSMSLQEVFLVNHSPSQAKERERMITAISGLTCSGPYIRSGPIGSLVRTLLASSRWYSPVRRLKWEVNPLYSERVSLYLKDDSNMLLKPFAVILNVKDIPSSRYLYRLVPSVHLTDGIEFGLLPTVTAQDYKRRGPNSRQQGLRVGVARVVENLLTGALFHRFPVVHDEYPVSDLRHHAHVVGDEDDRQPLLLHFFKVPNAPEWSRRALSSVRRR